MEQTSDDRVVLAGYIDVPNDQRDAVREALDVHINLTRAEKGCISFEVNEDVSCSGRFLVSEVFESQKAFDAHQKRTRNSDWFNVTKGMPRNYSITTAPAKTDHN